MSLCVVHTCAVHAHMCMYRDDCCGQLSSCIPLCLVCWDWVSRSLQLIHWLDWLANNPQGSSYSASSVLGLQPWCPASYRVLGFQTQVLIREQQISCCVVFPAPSFSLDSDYPSLCSIPAPNTAVQKQFLLFSPQLFKVCVCRAGWEVTPKVITNGSKMAPTVAEEFGSNCRPSPLVPSHWGLTLCWVLVFSYRVVAVFQGRVSHGSGS